ncbi:hypothetical protein [Paractinoplanes hotanensis]|uniref:SDR family oxidoreductase n=1 Tax=Paractinoplanes hotanensis TaxID=2906497 RepID=A0ABT0YAJ5_9ACTN|nr:hypothetical protein [Actinoplanes hotanensis]MCM4082805.1 hypothetical protein [Actinoplanes hotanensis]
MALTGRLCTWPSRSTSSRPRVAAAVVHLSLPEALWSSGAVLDLNGASYLR